MTDTISLGQHTTMLCGDERGKYPWGNPLLVEGSSGRMLIDSALSVPIPDVDIVALSHFHEDHTCGLSQRPDLDVRVHPADLDAVRDVDAFFGEGGYDSPEFRKQLEEQYRHGPVTQATALDMQPIDLGGVTVTPVHLPGHTAGHCGFLIEPDGVLFTADVDLSSFGPFYGDASASLADMRTSLDRASGIDAAVYSTYHHKREVRDRAEFSAMLQAFAAVMDEREQRVLSLLQQPATAADLVGKGVVYRPGKLPPYAAPTEQKMTQLHLDELAEKGAVVREHDGRYRLA
ncbi:MBL fold metallo-hydrolase [Blastococcus sp. Marseille-P5729]|uniref:MBL fold metallo-hydrolase n=1 Tax=Blastococcus sp. Marseille-P5729 TaxID=2086582 RepID=UPI000D0F3313|nr:MBL fold metallo-hydrolase [Blastococcus sp. Marseille-P5729]